MSVRERLDAISAAEGLRPFYAPEHDYTAQAVLDLPDGTCRVVGFSGSMLFVAEGKTLEIRDHNLAVSWRQHIQRVKAENA